MILAVAAVKARPGRAEHYHIALPDAGDAGAYFLHNAAAFMADDDGLAHHDGRADSSADQSRRCRRLKS